MKIVQLLLIILVLCSGMDTTAHEQSPQQLKIEAAKELLARRKARKSLVEFSTFTHPAYQVNWHHRVIAEHLEKLSRGELADHLMVFAPPRHGKSDQISMRFPAWELGDHPELHYICTAYGDELAADFSRGCRNTIESEPYQRLWRHALKTRQDTKWQLKRKQDDQRATYISSGILGPLTGQGANRLLVDDPVKNAEEAYSKRIRDKIDENYQTAAATRLQKGGKKILVMTRWHEDDQAGRLLKRATKDKKADQWIVLVFAATNDNGEESYIWNTRTGEKQYFPAYEALWPEMFSRETLDNLRANMSPVFWNALYMQRPTTPAGEIFKRTNWNWYEALPELRFLVQVYDGACEEGQENDYSASITMGSTGTTFPILDQWRDKVTFPYLMAKVYERWEICAQVYKRYPDRLLVENKSSGVQIAQQIETNNLIGRWIFPDGHERRVPPIPLVRMPAQQSKVLRAQGISGYHESKLILLPRGADWAEDFIDSHALFPKGPHDDWEDCTIHAVTYFTRPTEDHQTVTEHQEQVQIASDLDEFELRDMLGNW